MSQALLAGGMPFTDYWLCRISARPIFVCEGIGEFEPFKNAEYKVKPVMPSTINVLKTYGFPDYINYLGGVNHMIIDKNILPSLSSPHPDPENPECTDAKRMERQATAKAVGLYLNNQKVGIGDVFYAKRASMSDEDVPVPHTAIIVGWGPIIDTWDGLVLAMQSPLSPTYTDENPIPYVVDHGPHGEIALGGNYSRQNPYHPDLVSGPRPYYALMWKLVLSGGRLIDGSNLADSFKSGEARFIRVLGAPDANGNKQLRIRKDIIAYVSKIGFNRNEFLAGCPFGG
jgi:hypothetical protein